MNTRTRKRQKNKMAKKDFDEYYAQHYKSYLSAVDALTQISNDMNSKMISQEQLELSKQTLMPIIDAQRFLDYVKYLLDKPSRKQKEKTYNKQNKKILDSEYSLSNIQKSEQAIIEDFKSKRG